MGSINVNSYPMIVAMSSGSDVGKFTGTYYTFSMAAQNPDSGTIRIPIGKRVL